MAGRPTKFNSVIAKQCIKMAEQGMTDEVISEILNISRSTFSLWKKENKGFSDKILYAKEVPNKKVANSLFKRALGCKVKETKHVRRISRETGTMEDYEEVTTVKELPPDVGAATMYLTNRDAVNWKNKQDINSQVEVTEIKLSKKERLERIAELQSKLGKGK